MCAEVLCHLISYIVHVITTAIKIQNYYSTTMISMNIRVLYYETLHLFRSYVLPGFLSLCSKEGGQAPPSRWRSSVHYPLGLQRHPGARSSSVLLGGDGSSGCPLGFCQYHPGWIRQRYFINAPQAASTHTVEGTSLLLSNDESPDSILCFWHGRGTLDVCLE